jgi:hypothetical protein
MNSDTYWCVLLPETRIPSKHTVELIVLMISRARVQRITHFRQFVAGLEMLEIKALSISVGVHSL